MAILTAIKYIQYYNSSKYLNYNLPESVCVLQINISITLYVLQA